MARLAIGKEFLAEYAKLDRDTRSAVDTAIAEFARQTHAAGRISPGCAACSPTPNPSTGPETRNAVRSAKSGTRHRTGNSIGTARSSPRCDRRGRCPDRA